MRGKQTQTRETGVTMMARWELVETERDLTNSAYHFVTWRIHYDDGTILENRYRMPYPDTFHPDYQDMVVSRRKVRGKGLWVEGPKRRWNKSKQKQKPKEWF